MLAGPSVTGDLGWRQTYLEHPENNVDTTTRSIPAAHQNTGFLQFYNWHNAFYDIWSCHLAQGASGTLSIRWCGIDTATRFLSVCSQS